MHIPDALAKLGDRRAIPVLIKIIKEPLEHANNDSDSSDNFTATGGKYRLIDESCIALATFFGMFNLKNFS